MQKKSKISLIITIILMVSIVAGLIVYAVTINGKEFNNYGHDYYTKFGNTTNFWSFNKKDIDDSLVNGYYYGFDDVPADSNDYQEYVLGTKDAYCLNEDVGTGAGSLYLANIIDIEGDKITFLKSGTTLGPSQMTKAQKQAMADMAELLYNRYNGKITNNEGIYTMGTAGGWKNFYSQFATYIDDKALKGNLGGTYTINSTYANIIANLVSLKDNNTTTPMAVSGAYSVDGKEYKTKIGPYSLQLNTMEGITTSVSITAGDKNYTGTLKKENGYYYFYVPQELTEAPTQIKVKQSYTGYRARLILLATGVDQARAIGRGEKTTVTDELNITSMPLFDIDVSLQKYITSINGEALKEGDSKLIDRKNTYATNAENTVVSNSEKDSMKNGSYKHDNIVLIEEGDEVTYRVHVYNNSNVKANSITIRDKAIYYDNSLTQYSDYEIVKITRDGKNTDIKSEWKKVSGTTTDEYEYTIKNLAKNSSTYFDITIKINKYEKEKVLNNTAYIQNTVPKNDTEYRTEDSDYIKLTQYSTDGNKYISAIKDGDVTVNTQREEYTQGMTNANPVLIEKGDIVTYTIKVENTSDVETNIYVKDTITGFKYSELLVSDWSYEGGTGSLTKLTKTQESENVLKSEGRMEAGVKATCTISMKVEEILSTDGKGTNILETWIKKNIDDPEPELVEIPEYFQESKYLASLHKIVSSVNDVSTVTGTGVEQDRWASWESDENVKSKADKTYDKHNNPITVANGDNVTYTIKVKNDGTKLEGDILAKVNTLQAEQKKYYDELIALKGKIETSSQEERETYKTQFNAILPNYEKVSKEINDILEECTTFTITEIEEKLPSGVEFVSCSEGKYENGVITELNITLAPQEEKEITLTVKVTEPNISIKILKNEARIKTMKNTNGIEVEDVTLDNNNDADYIQLKDVTIEGTVWNDKALNKTQDNYNGQWDEKDSNGNALESKLQGIKVFLYRNNKSIAETVTDENGNYKFDASMINKEVVTHECERFIKAPYQCTDADYMAKEHVAKYWKQQYYTYYIVFEYDGITYTSTTVKDEGNCLGVYNNDYNDSNTKEDIGKVNKSREDFNKNFEIINNDTQIKYTTKNENGFIPQLNHIYDEKIMAIQASTEEINLANINEEQLKHVNLGLRGRDIFDLELTSDVAKVEVTINGQIGVYNYNNKVKLRNSDIQQDEDMANKKNEKNDAVVDSYTQEIREQDLKASTKAVTSKTVTKYEDQNGLQKIDVTYKITIANASKTNGTATQIINYYDNKYEIIEAKCGNKKLETVNGEESGSGFKSVIIKTPGTNLSQSKTMEIDLVLRLKNPRSTLSSLLTSTNPIPTYNMAEVYEYTTSCAIGQTIYTKGLIDKDSAPGTANTEKVNLTEGNSDLTTVGYYFKAVELSKLKYEDDTYATPTLYFGIPSDNNTRTLTGTIFRDETSVTPDSIKTGNGKQDEGEVGVYGATVELVELSTGKNPAEIAKGEGIIRYKTTSDKKGNYTFEKFLPGNYIVRYYFGDTKNTVVVNQHSTNINSYSYNGEDYQSTNNIGTYGANKLHGYNSTTGEFENTSDWYAYNEKDKISTGTENSSRRIQVSNNVIAFNDKTMDLLNDLRDGKDIEDDNDRNSKNGNLYNMINNTYMYASTPNFILTVEETQTDSENKNVAQKTEFSEYKVSNMNFGISEVPVTTIDLQKNVKSFVITDSAGENIITKVEKDSSQPTGWKVQGNVLPGVKDGTTILDTSIEEEKLQGAKLQVTYEVSTKIDIQKDFRSGKGVKPTITALADFIDNDLSYNKALGENDKYWEVKTAEDVKRAFEDYYNNNTVIGEVPKGTLDPDHTIYTSQVFAKAGNPILNEFGGKCEIILEKTLSSEEVTIGDIITSNINTYEYDNAVEILGLAYSNTEAGATEDHPFRDRVRRTDKYIILPGTRHDSATSEKITIHPPTGDTGLDLTYYVIAAISLVVLAVGVFGIKKFVVNAKK